MKRFATLLAAALVCAASFAQEASIRWSSEVEHIEGQDYRIVFTGKIADGLHAYSTTDEFSPTAVEYQSLEGVSLKGGLYDCAEPADYEGMAVFFNEIKVAQDVTLDAAQGKVVAELNWLCCTESSCLTPEYKTIEVSVPAQAVITQADRDEGAAKEKNGFNWAMLIEAILWGFAALLTPCVFPMVPMTVSFFMKGSTSPAAGRFKASMYGLFIVLLYTVPISLIILITRIAGGDAVTADIFNWLATHWLPNIVFFIVFMIFAASFFGAFEIVLPSSLVNKSDKGADKGGLLGIFFMALTIVLVSFSCTGPIVGSVLIKATQGEFWEPMVAMLGFSLAFALPFTILAFFPSLLKNLPKSGGWLNSVKVVLGFIEVALGFKFLSVADQTYHWGLLDREVYLAIWITVFSLLGLYLLGKLRFANDDKVEHISVFRLTLAIGVFSFVVYMVPGMFGAPLKALSGYLPPITSQDFVLGNATVTSQAPTQEQGKTYGLHLPHNLEGYFTLEEGLKAAREAGKPVFLDITGHGCVNCREMESRVWSDPKVLSILRNDYIIVALYTDDKQKLDEKDWVTTSGGEVLKTLGRANSYIARERFGVNAQPNYILLDPLGEQLIPARGYDLSVPGFIEFLNKGLETYRK
ncbi:MAG: protein-disulfide reductase DsbD family protein [Candidatus Cryptobacteroides sp.]